MEEMKNVALSSRLNADELKQVYNTAKEKVKAMDFAKYGKRKRKQAFAKLEEMREKHRKTKEREGRGSGSGYEQVDGGESIPTVDGGDEQEHESTDDYEFDDLFEEEDTEASFELEEDHRF